MADSLLEVTNLDVTYRTKRDSVQAVSNASFSIESNGYFGLVGESGCGKSTLARAVMNSLDTNGEISGGEIRYRGDPIHNLSDREYKNSVRWDEIAFIPQSAMNSLDPLTTVQNQALEIAQAHKDWSNEKTLEKLRELFDIVGLPQSRIADYPHQFSGGMKQRAIIALSLLLDPSLVIADEPTTALDVIMQDQLLKYLDELRQERDFSLLMITHDIAVVFELCDSIAVMHGGQIAETGGITDVFDEPRHPYSILLQRAFPDVRFPDRSLEQIEGTPPPLSGSVDYCTFADRCPWAEPDCRDGAPPLEPVGGDASHLTSCIRSDEMEELAASHLEGRSTGESSVQSIQGSEQ